ncbi:Uncharacterised protein [Escherichia coli]|jgi:hypothetical protein|nr:Uncharacterised protein [Escherichia coli]
MLVLAIELWLPCLWLTHYGYTLVPSESFIGFEVVPWVAGCSMNYTCQEDDLLEILPFTS